jgi:hypothetical protein
VFQSPANPQAGPLDLASASLGQQGTQLRLTAAVRGGAWTPAQLTQRGPRALCLKLAYGTTRIALCLASAHGRPILRRLPLLPPGRGARIPADVGVAGGSVTVAFTPADAGIPYGRLSWALASRWDGGADQIPDSGAIGTRASLLSEPQCFGAAARGCANPELRTVVTPTPQEALLVPNAPCVPFNTARLVYPCYFGVTAARATGGAIALVGDSHAEHWRAAVEVAAQARRWRAISLTRTSCPFNAAGPRLHGAALTATCARWNRELPEWLRAHPEIHTAFVSADHHTSFDGDAVAGYRAAWASLPPSVRRIYVLRDTPRASAPEAGCVDRLLRAHAVIGRRCAHARAKDLPPDPEAEAARGTPRVRLVDLTRFMCTAAICPPVIGGVLVRKDGSHLTRAFAETLGPYLLRAL